LLKKSLSGNGKYKINKEIQKNVAYLNEMYLLERDDIHSYLFEEFVTKKLYRKYGKNKTKPSTFISYYTDLSLKSLKRKYDTLFKNYWEIPLDYSSETTQYQGKRGISLAVLEKRGVEGVIEKTTPEDYLFAKEILDLMHEFFDENEVLVLLEYKTRRSEAERLSIAYYTYCKRLSRKKSAFKLILQEAGYC